MYKSSDHYECGKLEIFFRTWDMKEKVFCILKGKVTHPIHKLDVIFCLLFNFEINKF